MQYYFNTCILPLLVYRNTLVHGFRALPDAQPLVEVEVVTERSHSLS